MSEQMNLTLTEEMSQAVRDTADARGQSMAYLVREAIAMYLARTAGIAVREIHPALGGRRPGAGRKAEGGEA